MGNLKVKEEYKICLKTEEKKKEFYIHRGETICVEIQAWGSISGKLIDVNLSEEYLCIYNKDGESIIYFKDVINLSRIKNVY